MTEGDLVIPPIDISPDHWWIIRDILQTHVPQYPVWAFGSRVKGTARPYSDLDLVIVTDEPLALGVSAALADAGRASAPPHLPVGPGSLQDTDGHWEKTAPGVAG